ncbi:MAG: transposase [Moorea sp. SIO4A1]|uniref:transposase n=1 Tax=Moorena sp. SIO4A1 TaxID=2607835 RepID=UPI00144F2DA2|nr:transposase [Moorena sp. SIO4A1]NEQ57658.1 transposase [Moorena sp. SIO4A1]
MFALDESHVKAGEICGYGWGNRKLRREINVDNYQDYQTYYGALDCISGELLLRKYSKANSSNTIDFINYLQAQSPGKKIVIVWDGASYHRSQEFRDFLSIVNHGVQKEVHCLRFAPYAPEENPIENIWGQIKQILRHIHSRCRSFTITKKLFELFIEYHLFTMPDLSTYEAFSNLI